MRLLHSFSLAILLANIFTCLKTVHGNIAADAVMEFAKFHLLENDFLIAGRPSQGTHHKVVFAIKQNTELIESILLEVSDPRNSKYGQHLSRDQVSK